MSDWLVVVGLLWWSALCFTLGQVSAYWRFIRRLQQRLRGLCQDGGAR